MLVNRLQMAKSFLNAVHVFILSRLVKNRKGNLRNITLFWLHLLRRGCYNLYALTLNQQMI